MNICSSVSIVKFEQVMLARLSYRPAILHSKCSIFLMLKVRTHDYYQCHLLSLLCYVFVNIFSGRGTVHH